MTLDIPVHASNLIIFGNNVTEKVDVDVAANYNGKLLYAFTDRAVTDSMANAGIFVKTTTKRKQPKLVHFRRPTGFMSQSLQNRSF